MADIDRRYRTKSGLTERRYYSIFYSRIDPADAIVLGINPGGDPRTWTPELLASQSFYENWEHEYVDCRYAIQEPMLPFLTSVLGTDADGVRRIPKSNLAFRRSVGTDAFKATTGMTMTKGQDEAAPFVKEILAFVQPNVIILEGITLMDPFRRLYCSTNADTLIGEREYAMWRGRKVRILEARSMHVVCLNRPVTAIAIGHPSSFGMRPEFQNVVRRTADILRHRA